jgi:hypothetical protein
LTSLITTAYQKNYINLWTIAYPSNSYVAETDWISEQKDMKFISIPKGAKIVNTPKQQIRELGFTKCHQDVLDFNIEM